MILQLIPNHDAMLRTPTIPFDFDNPPVDPVELFQNLCDTMCEHRGVGLSANQVGLPYSVFVIGNPDDKENVIAVFNPKIVDKSDEDVLMEEGCLSYPGLYTMVKRPSAVRVRYTNQNGNTNTIKFDGFTARVFQHEFDHINGIVYTSRVSSIHMQRALRQKKKLDRLKKNADK
jgi:peptide deformylase